MAETHDVKYDEALKRLEKLVTDLDRSGLDLETRLKKFEEGTKLARTLLKKLEQAKKKVEVLVKTNAGDLAVAPFHDELAEDDTAEDAQA
jgi:exodeoxyribonuclease VII small subunit